MVFNRNLPYKQCPRCHRLHGVNDISEYCGVCRLKMIRENFNGKGLFFR